MVKLSFSLDWTWCPLPSAIPLYITSAYHCSQLVCLDYTLKIKFNPLFLPSGFLFVFQFLNF